MAALQLVGALLLCLAYDGFALLFAVLGGKHPAPFLYVFVVPSALMMTGFVLLDYRNILPGWLAGGAEMLVLVGLGMMLIAGRRYRRSPTSQP